MARKITEAAKLYFKDRDVLEEARSELIEYSETICREIFDELMQMSKDLPEENALSNLYSWEDQKNPVNIWIHPDRELPINLKFILKDFRNTEQGGFSFNIRTTKGEIRKFDKLPDASRQKIEKILRDNDVEPFSWENPFRLCESIYPIEKADLVTEITEQCWRYMQICVEIENVINEALSG